jgi:hypothetical protein
LGAVAVGVGGGELDDMEMGVFVEGIEGEISGKRKR